jgi:mannosyltransferase OCH1-like enzyme
MSQFNNTKVSHDTIPKIIHQLWIGPKPAPIKLMDTWKEKHPEFEYIRWNEREFIERNMTFECQTKIDEIEEYCGKADILRWEILYKYGGIFLDADSICIEAIDDELMNKKCFAGWENEQARPGLIAIGTMGFPPRHPLVREAIDWILKNEVSQLKTGMMAWQTVGPSLLTKLYNTGKYKDLHIFPSYTFLPYHFTGRHYSGHGKIYAYQEWGSTRNSYDEMNNNTLAKEYITPPIENSVSVLVSSYNTRSIYIKECLESIKHQAGWLNVELIWINDGSDKMNTQILKGLLDHFRNTTRFTKVVYVENERNLGLAYSLNLGVSKCSHELIIRMDSDDIMVNDRIVKQFVFMNEHPEIHVCGAQIVMFKEHNKQGISSTHHKSVTLDEYKRNPYHWIVNHPALCYRKSSILKIGNYNVNLRNAEDFELMLRVLKHYKYIHNVEDVLLYYRLHEEQTTHNGGKEGHQYWTKTRSEWIQKIIFE